MKLHALLLCLALSVVPLAAMGKKRLSEGFVERDGQEQEEPDLWKFFIPVRSPGRGAIINTRRGIGHWLLVAPEFKNFFHYAKVVKGTAFIQNGAIKILEVEGIRSIDDYYNEGISVEERPENVRLRLGSRLGTVL
jgi:hypothetical protein